MFKAPLPINDVARLFGIRASALRYYEEIALLKPAWRQGGRRFYDIPELKRLALIQLLQDACHLSLGEITDVLATGPNDKGRTILKNQVAALEQTIAAARSAKRYVEHRMTCPREDPVQDCPVLDHEVTAWLAQRFRGTAGEDSATSIAKADMKKNRRQ
ncbi:MerR family transcriptional regulator [Acetobacter sacchari]|uniref:MerR family transcriptional regulator n=1 Tax=Acetobacter sacchari TaxID=2661687 RepID=A0ABS3LSV2_9PROT|nr:MerR family transcriptional regulator [Acetobacter sacchari]MBO1358989.1 MerR family transcriptional regulator [Acetobacter sacchari]